MGKLKCKDCKWFWHSHMSNSNYCISPSWGTSQSVDLAGMEDGCEEYEENENGKEKGTRPESCN